MDNIKNYITSHTICGVAIVVDSTHKEAVISVVNAYFDKSITEEDLNEDGSYTMRLHVEEGEIKEESDN